MKQAGEGATVIQLRKILVPVDFSAFSERALDSACSLAEQFEAEVHLLYVSDAFSCVFPEVGMPTYGTGEFLAQQAAIASDCLLTLPGAQRQGGLTIVRQIRDGTPYAEIINYADEESVDLIVMGTHGRSGLEHVLLGSVATHVVRESPCPVMTVPGTASDFSTADEQSGDENSAVFG